MKTGCQSLRLARGRRGRSGQRGMTMIEVLITLVIVSFGLLGAGALQLMSLQVNQNANQRTQAAMLAASMMDAVRLNRFSAMDYAMGWDSPIPAASATNMVQNDKHVIGTLVNSQLPNGEIQVTVNTVAGTRPFYDVEVSIRWSEAGRLVDRNQDDDSPTVFSIAAQI